MEARSNPERGSSTLHPAATERLHQYWVHGEGAAKIRWGTPGDFDRCVRHLSKYIHGAQGYCNLAHKSATGMYPAQHAKMMGKHRSENIHMPTVDELVRIGMRPEDVIRAVNQTPSPRPTLGVCVRDFSFEFEARSDGRTLEGYAAVFDTPTTIRDVGGDFRETIKPGAFKRSLQERTPILQWDHGKDPRIGTAPIGSFQRLAEDSRGLHVQARLFEHDDIERVRMAIAAGAITGMSFRFSVPEGGDEWPDRDTRNVHDLDAYELGPVAFPAYHATSVTVRSMLAQLDPDEHLTLIRELAAELRALPDLSDFIGREDTRSASGDDATNKQADPLIIVDNDELRRRGIL